MATQLARRQPHTVVRVSDDWPSLLVLTLAEMRPSRVLLVLLAAAVTALSAAPAQGPGRDTGTIRGRVLLPDVPAASTRPAVADLSARSRPPSDRRTVVVYLESAPLGAFDEIPAGRARMDQRGEEFIPRVLPVTIGTTVDFPNNDETFHNVFSLSRVRTFDLGRYRPGRTGAVRFDRPGIVPIFCDIHSHMSAYVLVFNHPYFAVSDTAGRYELRDVPAGPRTVMVWSELGTASPRRVTVTADGTVEADFRVTRDGP